MNDRDEWLAGLCEAVSNLLPGEELPEKYRYKPSPTRQLVDQWHEELGELLSESFADPIGFVGDDAKLNRRRELMDYIRHAGDGDIDL
jgi:hypothetical protein